MDIVIERTIARLVSINGYICRVWYKGQPIICNSCGAQGHKANECPDKDKCHRCGETGHLARHCTNSWGTRFADVQDAPSAGPSNSVYPGAGADSNANHDPPDQGASVSELELDPESFSVSTDISVGADSPELVIKDFSSSSQSSFRSISDFSSESKSIPKPVEVDNVKESNVINDNNVRGNINNSVFINESIDVKKL